MTAESDEEKQLFYREVPVDSASLAFRRFFTTNFALRCPACGLGGVAAGPFAVRDRCERCGSRYKRLEGNELISISLSFFLASLVTFLVALPLILGYGFFPGITWVLVLVGVLAVVLLLRPTRVLALWLLWLLGFVYPDWVGRGITSVDGEAVEERRRMGENRGSAAVAGEENE